MAGNGGNIVLIFPELKSVIVVTRTNYNSPTQAMETIQLVSKYIIPKLLKWYFLNNFTLFKTSSPGHPGVFVYGFRSGS